MRAPSARIFIESSGSISGWPARAPTLVGGHARAGTRSGFVLISSISLLFQVASSSADGAHPMSPNESPIMGS